MAGLTALLLAERDRWPLWLPVLFGVGIAFYFALPVEPVWWLGPVLTCAVLGLMIALRGRDTVLAGLSVVLMLVGGFAAVQVRALHVDAPIIERRTPPLPLLGTLLAVERRADARHRLLIAVEDLGGWSADRRPARVRVTTPASQSASLRPGDRVRLRVVVMPPPAPAAPDAFDFARQAWFQRLGGVGFTLGAPELVEPAAVSGPSARIARWRDGAATRIRDALPGPTGAIAAAVLTGKRGGIAEADWEALRNTGLAHLLAISGLHMTAIAAFIFFLVRGGLALIEPIALQYPVKKWAAVAAAVAAAAYLALSGASVSTQRAFVMILVAMVAVLLDRPVLSMRTVAAAAMVILVLRPESLVLAGFQMSFAAVTGLIAGYEAWRRWRPSWAEPGGSSFADMGHFLGGIAMTTVIASLAVAPFAAYHFNRLGAYDLLANLVAVPLFSLLVMPFGLASLIAMPVGLEAWPLMAMGAGIDGILWVAHGINSWPGVVALIPSMPVSAFALMSGGGLWLCLWVRPWRLAGLGAVVAGILVAAVTPPPDVLVGREGRMVAVRDGAGRLSFPTARGSSFVRKQWLRRDGEKGPVADFVTRTETAQATPGAWRCDAAGCTATLVGGGVLALARTQGALMEDCVRADWLVSAVPVRGPCAKPQMVIDRFDVWREGAHAVWIDDAGTAHVRTARDSRGERPWVLPRLRDREH